MTTMLDKVAVAGDITQALDRRGVATVAITVIGGTESTAVKLQSCETADGSFTDFKELIPASGATADQYKGFVVDLNGAGKFIKVVGATMATAVFGDCDYDVKEVAIKAGEIPSGADLEDNKTATIDVSTYTEPVEIEPTDGKDGMKKVTVTLSNIPSEKEYYLYNDRVICEASTFDEISLGMKAIITHNSAEGNMIYANCVSIENDTATFEDSEGYYPTSVEKSDDVAPFSTIFG